MPQKIITLDSQVLNSIQSCARKTQYNFVQHIEPVHKAGALEKGDLLHQMMEVYYTMIGGLPINKTEEWQARVKEVFPELIDHDCFSTGVETAREMAIRAAPYHMRKLEITHEECEQTIKAFKEYSQHYKDDPWTPLAVEQVGSKVLYEDEDVKIIYSFKIDVIMERGRTRIPWDHKSSSKRSNPSSMSNQFMGYCWGLGTDMMIVNSVGFQKTLKPEEKFQRLEMRYNPERIKEWVENSIFWAFELIRCIDTDYWPLNLTSCDKYSGCIYEGICSKARDNRIYTIERDYKIGREWDVARILEGEPIDKKSASVPQGVNSNEN